MVLLIGWLIFISIIFIHELGHFIVGKLFGIEFVTFSVGMGPRLFQKRIGNTIYCLSILPLGGYVRNFTKSNYDDSKHSRLTKLIRFLLPVSRLENDLMKEFDKKESTYDKISSFGYISYVLAGCAFNLFSMILCFALYVHFKIPKPDYSDLSVIKNISQEGAAYKSGFRHEDRITSVNGYVTKTWGNVVFLLNTKFIKNAEAHHTVSIKRDGQDSPIEIKVKDLSPLNDEWDLTATSLYKRFFNFNSKEGSFSFIEALRISIDFHKSLFLHFFTKSSSEHAKNKRVEDTSSVFSGPAQAMMDIGFEASESLLQFVIVFIAVSFTAIIINLLPIPGTDGFHVASFMLEKYFKIEISFEKRAYICYISFAGILLLTIVLTIKDLLCAWF